MAPGFPDRPARAKIDDARELNALACRSYSGFIPVMDAVPAPMLTDLHALVRDHEVWVIRGDTGLIGSLALIRQEDHLLIESIAVDPDHQGGGAGRFLLDFARIRAAELGLGVLRLYTNVRMVRNRDWYKRAGFEETGHEQRGDKHIVHMKLTL
ncbi:MAG: GNAT family N-acetyltransferase [Roseibium sp.]|nr:GNAT family N-acetyltransferase [Roseibium sp.]